MRAPVRVILGTWVASLALAGLYLTWVWTARQPSPIAGRRGQHGATQPYPGAYSGTGLKILQFYPSALDITDEQSALLCYGVANARSVRIEPGVEAIRPLENKCIEVAPKKTTTYRLVAEGRDGTLVSESCTVQVRPAPPSILFVDLNSDKLTIGQPLILCYGTRNTTKVELKPALGLPLVPSPKRCVRIFPVRTTRFVLTVTGPGGQDREQFTVRVAAGNPDPPQPLRNPI